MYFNIEGSKLQNFDEHIRKEWALTNGIGGYAGGSILGALNRTHQGYLIASLRPPVQRYVVFTKTNESISQGGYEYNLETSMHAGEELSTTVVNDADVPDAYKAVDTVSVASDFCIRKPVYTNGQKYLTDFVYDGTVTFTYEVGALRLTKTIALVQGENKVAVGYEIENRGEDATVCITPLMNYKEHNQNVEKEDLVFELAENEHEFTLIPKENPDYVIRLGFSDGTLTKRTDCFDEEMMLQTEVDNETPGLDTHFKPFDITVTVPANSRKQVSLICKIEPVAKTIPLVVEAETAFDLILDAKRFAQGLIAQAGYEDEFADALVVAANQFLSHRTSTGMKTVLAGLPWFTDWGRDTMIAFTGVALSTKRFEEAKEILATFAEYVHNGLVPNMFPDGGQEPLYNTVDASMWYFYAVDRFLEYYPTDEAKAFVKETIYPALCEIVEAYKKGTDFSIYMTDNYLIHAGSGNDQVTWMDVRVGDWVVTPRHGCPVEINALWYNALMVMDSLSAMFGEPNPAYRTLAESVKESFCKEFWYEEGGYLYDVVDGTEKDNSLRPNQIYAVSLPYTMLSKEQAFSVVSVVERELYAKKGIRSLATSHKDYHPIYCGSLPKRDAAYHQGTAWGFIMGGFITAYMKVQEDKKAAAAQANAYLDPVREHLWEGCIGSISEIFDGDAPHTCRGCYAQAWSVGEVLRCYTEDILPNL